MSGFIQFNNNVNQFLADLGSTEVQNMKRANIENVSTSIHKIKSAVDSGTLFKGGPVSEGAILASYQNLDRLREGKVQLLNPQKESSLSPSQKMDIADEILIIKSAMQELMSIRDELAQHSLPLTKSSIEAFGAEWDKNAIGKNTKKNILLLGRLMMDKKISNAQLYQFFADKQIKPTGGWFVKEGKPTSLASEFANLRKMEVGEFFAKYSTPPLNSSTKVDKAVLPQLHPTGPKTLTRENFSEHMQEVVNRHYGQPFPHRDQVAVTVNGTEKKWVALTNEEKYQALWDHSLPHNRPKLKKLSDFGGNQKAWQQHLDDRLFRGSHKVDGAPTIFLPHDPRADHGSDHGVRVAIFSAVFGHLYDKYHPDVSLNPTDYLVMQLTGAFHDSGRQTEGVDIDDDRSAQIAHDYLGGVGVESAYVDESAKAIREKDDPHLSVKHVIAKSVQCADSAEYVRLFGTQSKQAFEESGNFLDIVNEFKSMPGLKGGNTFADFKKDLDGIRGEMNQLILETKHKRSELSEPGKNYYDEILKHVTAEKYPKLHAALTESGVISSAKPIQTPGNVIPVSSAAVKQHIDEKGNPQTSELEQTNQLFPGMLNDIVLVNASIGGSTGAQLVADSEGNKFVKKMPGAKIQPDHLRSEYHTNKAYKALGVDVPEVALYHSVSSKRVQGDEATPGGQPVMLSKFIPGKTQEVGKFLKVPSKINSKGTGVAIDEKWKKENAGPLKQVQDLAKKNFVADCLLANWDVAGLEFDNMLIDVEANKIWRIDNGAGLDYRAQGGKKDSKFFGAAIQEFFSLRNPAINPNTALLYETLTDEEIIDQINELLPKREAFLASIPPHLQEVMSKRFEYMRHYGNSLTGQLEEKKESLNRINQFIMDYQKNPNQDLKVLKKGLSDAYAARGSITDPVQKTAILTIFERVAQAYIDKGELRTAIAVRMMAAQAFQPAGPLANLPNALQMENPKLGVHIYPVDTGLFKNHDLMVQKRTVEGQTPHLHLEGKLNNPARDNIESTLKFITDNTQDFFKLLPPGFCKGVNVSEEQAVYHSRKQDGNFSPVANDGFAVVVPGREICNMKVIHFEGVGTVRIGVSNPLKYAAMYNRISIDLDPSIPDDKAAEKLSIMLSTLGLGAAASVSRPVDDERIQILQLFRAFYPSEAYTFERDMATFKESNQSLISRIETKVPAMKALFQRYLKDEPDLMYKQEVYPGQSVWCVKGLSDEVKKAGGMGLMAGVTAPDFTQSIQRLMSMLRTGALSTQDRFQVGITISGDSSAEDLRTGGAGSVFARMLTTNMPLSPSSYPLKGQMQILYDLKLVERVGYAYEGDTYGSKDPSVYGKRSNVVDLAKKYRADSPHKNKGNEVCINHRVGPEFIKGLLVSSENEKQTLINALRDEGFLTNEGGIEHFNGVPIAQFVHVGDFDPSYWD